VSDALEARVRRGAKTPRGHEKSRHAAVRTYTRMRRLAACSWMSPIMRASTMASLLEDRDRRAVSRERQDEEKVMYRACMHEKQRRDRPAVPGVHAGMGYGDARVSDERPQADGRRGMKVSRADAFAMGI